jgi:4-diphosphocytidyl-2-C-methyl-D-erythritol kinase
MTSISILAPAKINLGLEVLRRRDDGFHEIATVMQTVALYDRLAVSPSDEIALEAPIAGVADTNNLVIRAARLLADSVGIDRGAMISIEKSIPMEAGLGGASSDAAATLCLLSELWQLNLDPEELAELALQLGSDVPFFLQGGAALAEGRGERLTSIRPLAGCRAVIATPPIHLANKTALLYRSLVPSDFSDGARAREVAMALEVGDIPDPTLLTNAFSRPWAAIAPVVATLQDAMLAAGAPFVALSGAGPSHYTLVTSPEEATVIGQETRRRSDPETIVNVCKVPGASPERSSLIEFGA